MQQPLFDFTALFKSAFPKYVFITPLLRFIWIQLKQNGCNVFTLRRNNNKQSRLKEKCIKKSAFCIKLTNTARLSDSLSCERKSFRSLSWILWGMVQNST